MRNGTMRQAILLMIACSEASPAEVWAMDWAMRRVPLTRCRCFGRGCSHMSECMTTISSDARLPLDQRLREYLAGRIAAQHWKADGPIPSKAELLATHGISVGSVRKAVDCLVA